MGNDCVVHLIFHAGITHLLVCLYVQTVFSRQSCDQYHYLQERKCCKKCPPGMFAFRLCTRTSDTVCRPCGRREYQPDWNEEKRCLVQKNCDKEMGFEENLAENHTAALPCRCQPGRQCSIINCEYCKLVCAPGYGLNRDEWGREACTRCRPGHFSSDSSATQPCKPWTNCTALGKIDEQPGNETTDAVCGLPIVGHSISWVAVMVLAVVTVASLVILVFCFCTDKFKSISGNVRRRVQNLKRIPVNQATLSAPQSGGFSPDNCTLEMACLIGHAENGANLLKPCTNDRQEYGDTRQAPADQPMVITFPCNGPTPPRAPGPCSCGIASKEPMEVGENEDCSQAVAICSCRRGTSVQKLSVLQDCHEGAAAYPDCADLQGACNVCADLQGPCNVCADFCSRETKEDTTWSTGKHRARTLVEGEHTLRDLCPADFPTTLVMSSGGDGNQRLSLPDIGDTSLGPESEGSSNSLASDFLGQRTGSKTTFISVGEVVNFSGDVIVVHVNQEHHGSGAESDEAIGSPVQEELAGIGQNKDCATE